MGLSICALTRATPYSLVYGSEVVLPIEVEIQSLRVLVETKVQYHAQGYQKRIVRAFNKKVILRNLKEGDLVLKVLRERILN